jgi:hypothetical protein
LREHGSVEESGPGTSPGVPESETKAHSAAWYPKTEYSLSAGEETQTEEFSEPDLPETNKYGALKPIEITPADVLKKGVALQSEEERS